MRLLVFSFFLLNIHCLSAQILSQLHPFNFEKELDYPRFFATGAVGTDNIQTGVDEFSFPQGGWMFHASAGYQANPFIGLGGTYYRSQSFVGQQIYNIDAVGLVLNGTPSVFYYQLMLAPITRYQLMEDQNYPKRFFKKSPRFNLMNQVQLGIRFYRYTALSFSYNFSSFIRGTYRQLDYENPTSSDLIQNKRKTLYSGYNIRFGVVF